MNILHVIPALKTGGVEKTTIAVANGIAAAYPNVHCFIAAAYGPLRESLSPNVKYYHLPLASKNPFQIISNYRSLKELCIKHRIDIIHPHSRAPAWSAYFAAKSLHLPFVSTYHGAYGQNALKWYYNRVMALGTPVIAPSMFIKKHVLNYYPGTKVEVIPSSIDALYFDPSLTNQEKYCGNEDGITIAIIGRFSRIKGHIDFLQMLENYPQKHKLKVVFVGDHCDEFYLQQIQSVAAKTRVNLTVHQNIADLREAYASCDVVAIPSIKPEAFGRVTAEAMAMEKITIGNNLGATPEVIGNKKWLYRNQNELFTIIDQVLSLTTEQRIEIGKANRQRVLENYDTQIMLQKHFAIYTKLYSAITNH